MLIEHNEWYEKLFDSDIAIEKIFYEIFFYNKEENKIEAHFYYDYTRIDDPDDLKTSIIKMCENAEKNYGYVTLGARLISANFVYNSTKSSGVYILTNNPIFEIHLED